MVWWRSWKFHLIRELNFDYLPIVQRGVWSKCSFTLKNYLDLFFNRSLSLFAWKIRGHKERHWFDGISHAQKFIRVDLKMVCFFLGQHRGYTKYPCFCVCRTAEFLRNIGFSWIDLQNLILNLVTHTLHLLLADNIY